MRDRTFRIGRTTVTVQARMRRPDWRRMPEGVALESAWQIGPFVGMKWRRDV